MNGIVSVDELARAYRAAVTGEFRTGERRADRSAGGAEVWAPGAEELVVAVVGCLGGAGSSTVALGIASAAGDARVVECCTVAASGLGGASSAELGSTPDGWVQGSRGPVLVERRGDRMESPARCPAPAATTRHLTVVDCGWDVDLLFGVTGWLGALVRDASAVVAVTRPTLPGLRRLETAAGLLGTRRAFAVLVGVEKRWSRRLEEALGPYGRTLRAAGRLTELPQVPTLAMDGLTPEPLPTPILTGCSALLDMVKGSLR